VSTETLLRAAITRNPKDNDAFGALFDFFQQYHDWSPFHCLLTTHRVRRAAINAVEIKEATACLARGSIFRDPLYGIIRQIVNCPRGENLTVLVVAGRRIPRADVEHMFTDGEWVHGWVGTVGAKWVIDAAMSLSCFSVARAKMREQLRRVR